MVLLFIEIFFAITNLAMFFENEIFFFITRDVYFKPVGRLGRKDGNQLHNKKIVSRFEDKMYVTLQFHHKLNSVSFKRLETGQN